MLYVAAQGEQKNQKKTRGYIIIMNAVAVCIEMM